MRGIIVTSEFEGDENSLIMFPGGINPNKLRQYILYWDKIDYPSNNIMYKQLTPDEEYLVNAGVMQRTDVRFWSDKPININPLVFINAQIETFKNKSQNIGEVWNIAQPTRKIILPRKDSFVSRSIQVELLDCLPVPTSDVNLEDILNFKEKRYHELLELRALLDEMYTSIINSADIGFEKNRCIEKVQNKIIEIDRVMNESGIRRFFSNFKTELNVSSLLKSGLEIATGYTIGSHYGFPVLGAITGLVTSSINITADVTMKPNFIPDDLKDYAYLLYARKELV